ncbi:MAG: D-alanyl-D-alanine carboxypeptidase family protein [Candidatus Scatovivens sp.]
MKFIQKLLIFFLIIIILPVCSLADDLVDDDIDYINTLEVSSDSDNIILSSKYALVLERSTNSILFEKNAYERTAMASTTKIMTAIIALENSSLTDTVKISSKAAHTGGSTLGIYSDTQMSMESLLYGLLLRSGNDCAVAIAEYIGGNLEEFADLMNKKAEYLGLKNTHFVTPHGLDSNEHYTTAYDLALLTNYALKNNMFFKIVGTKNCTISVGEETRTITNTNELLRLYRRCIWCKNWFHM